MAAIVAVAAASKAKIEDVENVIINLAAFFELDDMDVAKGKDEDDGNVPARGDDDIGNSSIDSGNDIIGNISNNNNQGDNSDKGGGVEWERVTKNCKSEMSDEELCIYLNDQLKGIGECPNWGCYCVKVLSKGNICVPVVRYFCWFNVKKTEKIDQSEFWAKLKVTTYSNDKEWVESMALDEGEGKV